MSLYNKLVIKNRLVDFSSPLIMGIINLTPDSFYSESRQKSISSSLEKANSMIENGADIIDIGAQSTRHGAKILNPEEEWQRLEPFLQVFCKNYQETIISIDTYWSEVAKRAVDYYNIDIINDVSGGTIDSKMYDTIADLNITYILMHMRGTPENMMQKTNYSNLISDIINEIAKKIKILHQKGVHNIIVDPGFGFSKNVDQNYVLLNNLEDFKILNAPLLVGLSRKSMIWRFLEISPEDSLIGSIVLNTIAVLKGANIIRVHDVLDSKQLLKLINKTHSSNLSGWK
ncbi:MAG: dihydropteroate synthase [Bacteroidales bacterium]|nr:dihydropteroate synthase [Bacteroidales bacterium]MDD4234406.1 dihydropteroate synthase [Bacteroidales bacterium]